MKICTFLNIAFYKICNMSNHAVKVWIFSLHWPLYKYILYIKVQIFFLNAVSKREVLKTLYSL